MSLLLLCGFLFFYRLGDRDLTSSHEARAAQDAQTILTTGDWGLPRLFDDKPELQKPPLYYWLVVLSARLRGGAVNAWDVRLPAALAALGTVMLVYVVGWKLGRPRVGFLAAVMLATSIHFTWLARVGRIDMPLTSTVTVALLAFYVGKDQRGWCARRSYFLAYLAVGMGLLLKGPIAVVLPGIVAATTLLLEWRSPLHERRGLPPPGRTAGVNPAARFLRVLGAMNSSLGLWWGMPLVVLIAGPWFFWANAKTGGEFFRVFFWYHNVQRGLGGAEALQAHPWWFYLPRLALDLAPWSILLPPAAWLLGHRYWKLDPLARFGAVWLAAMTVLLSCMRFKRADYLLPAYPGAALLLGCVIDCWWQETALRADARSILSAVGRLALPLILGAYLVGWFVYVERVEPAQDAQHSYSKFAAEIRRRTSEIIVFFRAEAHNLAFHLGRPMTSLLEWENLDWWVGRPESVYVIMPPDCAAQWRQHLTRGELDVVLESTAFGQGNGERPLVLVRTRSLGKQSTFTMR